MTRPGRIDGKVVEGTSSTVEGGDALSVSFRETTKRYPGADRAAVEKLSLELIEMRRSF